MKNLSKSIQVCQRIWHFICGPAMAMALMGWLMVLVSIGTVAQAYMPLVQALVHYFSPWVVWVGGVLPVPGVPPTLLLLTISMANQLYKQPFTRAKMGLWLAHAGVLLVILAGLGSTLAATYGYVMAAPNQPTRYWQAEGPETTSPSAWPALGMLPFTVTLEHFEKRLHAGTTIPAAFSSAVLITPDHGEPWRATIRMNEPLQVQGYTLYQASYFDEPNGPTHSVLAVVKDPSRLFPLLATVVLGLGLLWHAFARFLPKKLWVAVLLFAPIVHAPQAEDVSPSLATLLAATPVQHEGRLKPLEAAALKLVPFVTGEEASGADATTMVLEWVLNPQGVDVPLFKLTHPAELGLEGDSATLFTARTLMRALAPHEAELARLQALPPAKLAAPQMRLVALSDRVLDYLQLSRTAALLRPFPLPDAATAKRLGVDGNPLAYQVLQPEVLQTLAKLLSSPQGQKNPTLFAVAETLRGLRPEVPSTLLRVIPPATPQGDWLPLGQAGRIFGTLTPTQKTVFNAWIKVVNDPTPANAQAVAALSKPIAPTLGLLLERLLLVVPLLTLAGGLLGVAMLLGLVQRSSLAYGVGCFALLVLSSYMVARVVILQRPPVATLYESVLFVSWVALVWALVKRGPLMPLLLGLVGLLVGVAHVLSAQGDTLGMLTAVLNTRFWLIVHVLTITAGYATSLLAGTLALATLWLKRPRTEASKLRALMIISLLLVAVGTLLGGWWASQSWGRFWGWDPKENGALVLTLWLAMAAHAPQLKTMPAALWLGMLAGTPVVVALSWFGVNLLGVGLHSYGFTSGITGGLILFCLTYITVWGWAWLRGR